MGHRWWRNPWDSFRITFNHTRYRKAEDIRIFDPAPQLLTQWRNRTAATGMQFLRSASVHHVDVDPWSLDKFAGGRKGKRTAKNGLFAPPYARPALELFNAHCDHVIEVYGLKPLHIQERVMSCEVSDDSVSLTTDSGHSFAAANMVLAIGGSEEPARPAWAQIDDSRVTHIFETSTNAPFQLQRKPSPSSAEGLQPLKSRSDSPVRGPAPISSRATPYVNINLIVTQVG